MPGVEEPPERPIKKWRTLFENKNLDHKDLIQYIQTAAPFFITCSTEVKESSELGECANFATFRYTSCFHGYLVFFWEF